MMEGQIGEKVIRCLSVRQPYASWLMMQGTFKKHRIPPKKIENRDWFPRGNYKGPLLIHASKTFEEDALDYWFDCFEKLEKVVPTEKSGYPLGVILGVVNLTDILTASTDDWFVGRYGWVMMNPKPFQTPVPYRGQLNLFNIPVSVVPELQKD